MREIKAPRIWIKSMGVMVKAEDVVSIDYRNVDTDKSTITVRICETNYRFVFDSVELMWPTGLKDHTGKEIYEGDITESEEMGYSDSGHFVGMRKVIGVVVYTSGRFALHHVTGKLPDLNFGLNYHKVIGNRYENPELLGGTGA